MEKPAEDITPEDEISKRVREIIEQPAEPETDMDKRAQEIIAEAVEKGAGEGEIDYLCEGGAYEQAEEERLASVIEWIDSQLRKQ